MVVVAYRFARHRQHSNLAKDQKIRVMHTFILIFIIYYNLSVEE